MRSTINEQSTAVGSEGKGSIHVKMQTPKPERWWDDEEFQDKLTALLIYDHQTLKSCASLLTPDDFKPV